MQEVDGLQCIRRNDLEWPQASHALLRDLPGMTNFQFFFTPLPTSIGRHNPLLLSMGKAYNRLNRGFPSPCTFYVGSG